MSDVPTLETERLILRGFRPDDTEPFIAAMAKAEFASTITREGRALDRTEAWRNLATVNGSWSLCGFGNWVVVEKTTGLPVGRLGPFAPPGWPDFEIGWAIFPEHWRKGYGQEGAAAAMVWVRETLGRDYVIHCILPTNIASQKLARSLGSELEGTWGPPWGGEVGIWRTRWDRFVETDAYRRQVAWCRASQPA